MSNLPTDLLLQEEVSEDAADRDRGGLFADDTGSLPGDVRRVIVQLLLGPAVDARRQTKLWPVLLQNEAIVRSRLHDLFLELVLDRDVEVAFTRQVVSPEVDIPILLRKHSLTFLESVLLIFLRSRLTQANAQGERAVLSFDEMKEHLATFEPSRNTDHARFGKQVEGAVEKAKKLSLLQKIRGSEDRYEVSPTLKLLFPAEVIQELSRIYEGLRVAEREPNEAETEVDVPPDDEAEL
jgi:hypothetical protein